MRPQCGLLECPVVTDPPRPSPATDPAAGAEEELARLRAEVSRLRRLEALEALLETLAGALDVRDVFDRVSEIADRVLPHDAMALGLVDEDRRHLRVWAHTAPFAAGLEVPDRVPIPDPALLARDWEFLLVDDLDLAPDVPGGPVIRRFGFRSLLRIPIRDGEELLGGVNFLCAAPGRFSPGDVIVGRRIAGHLHLALSHHRLAEEVRRASEARERARQLEQKVDALVEELSGKDRPLPVVGESAAWKRVLSDAVKVAAAETTVLLTGESGTGKEVLARLLHGASGRAKGPFVALNCAALPDSLLESELFGYEKGAFTGAGTAKPGRIELAQGGVLFLDEVAETSPAVQAKLLRVLQEREFQRLGGTRTQKADIRVVAATNRDLRAATARGEFREDLFYRLAVFEIRIPPLRERPEDVLPLSAHFLAEIGSQLGRASAGLSRDVRERLLAHAWPGNVRELRNVLERASILCEGGLITGEHLALYGSPPAAKAAATPVPGRPAAPADEAPSGALASVERAAIESALRECRFNKCEAARRLGISRGRLYGRMRALGIDAGVPSSRRSRA